MDSSISWLPYFPLHPDPVQNAVNLTNLKTTTQATIITPGPWKLGQLFNPEILLWTRDRQTRTLYHGEDSVYYYLLRRSVMSYLFSQPVRGYARLFLYHHSTTRATLQTYSYSYSLSNVDLFAQCEYVVGINYHSHIYLPKV